MTNKHVVIVGAGLAGAAAALKLSKAGLKVNVLEARDRIGGRAFSKSFDTDLLEFGGSWITPWHQRIRTLVQEHGLGLRPRQNLNDRLWVRNGTSVADGPVETHERYAHEKAIARVAADAALVKKGIGIDEHNRPLFEISYKDYMDRVNPPLGTRHVFDAWWTVSGNGAHDEVVASEFLSSCSYGDGLADAMIECWADTVVPSVSTLAEHMLKASGAELRLNSPVRLIEQFEDHVAIRTENGELFSCSQCLIALGVNQLGRMHFKPMLPYERQVVVEKGHAGRAFKVWIKARGVALGTLVTGDGSGIEFLFAERHAEDGSTLLIGFGIDQGDVKPGDSAWVKMQVSKLLPNVEYVSSDWHDWKNDAFAKGTWVATPKGFSAGFDSRNWTSFKRVHFASSDIAREQAGWFEGAVISGEDAAEAILKGV